MTCEISSRIAGVCACGAQLEPDCHVVSDLGRVTDLYCKNCCRVCRAVPNFTGQTISMVEAKS
jgi:hypothetical protein